jgi:anthranilate/para-aminobenzoate synthase component II
VHGKASAVHHARSGTFADLPSPISAARYHSLAIERDSMPPELEVTAWSDDGVVMGVRHRTHPVEGFQFHPESILTEDGEALLSAFLARIAVPA